MSDNIADTLKQRGSRYGNYEKQSAISDALIAVMEATPGWKLLAPHHREALRMDCVKTARILNGDPNYDDNWRDKAGYAQLLVNIINGVKSE